MISIHRVGIVVGIVGVVLALRWIALDRLVGPGPTPAGPGLRPAVWSAEWSDGGRIEHRRDARLGDGSCRLAPGGAVSVRFDEVGPAPRRLDWAYSGDRLVVEIRHGRQAWVRLVACPPSAAVSQVGLGLPPELQDDLAGRDDLLVRVSTPADGRGAVLTSLALSNAALQDGPPVLVEPRISRTAATLLASAVSVLLIVAVAIAGRRRRPAAD